ncbi:MAG: fused MFS/spermidine synthase [Candidatus Tectomicrobia bacterium]|nr:fused MFS/spermidine synthase [Candidatus Tectomicrobia bacterium]
MTRTVGISGDQHTRKRPAAALYGLAVFTSACLVFWVQPLAVRGLLPVMGGSPLVWNTAMVFFQSVLLLGYVAAHLMARHLPRLGQLGALSSLWLVVVLGLWGGPLRPFGESPPLASGDALASFLLPALWLLGTLAAEFGAACLAASMLTPLVSSWLAGEAGGEDAYRLYAASNAGSIGVLLLYPFLLEPLFGVWLQVRLWHAALGVLIMVLVALGDTRKAESRITLQLPAPLPRLRIMALAALPSGLLFAVTQRLTTDVASAPFLWVLPLALYLATYVCAFSGWRWFGRFREALGGSLVPCVLIAVAVFHEMLDGSLWSGCLHLLFFGVAALYCHDLLQGLRPPARGLTRFYVWLSAGGVVGGAAVTLAAPLVLPEVWEYQLLFAAVALFLVPAGQGEKRLLGLSPGFLGALSAAGALAALAVLHGTTLPALWGAAVTVALLACAPGLSLLCAWPRLLAAVLACVAVTPAVARMAGETQVARERTFFGVYRVVDKEMDADGQAQPFRLLWHGTTLHGAEAYLGDGETESRTTYYAVEGPQGEVFGALQAERPALRIGLAGLGVGSMLCHTRPADAVRVYEIDPAVVEVARRHFTALGRCGRNATVLTGDARWVLEREAEGSLDFLSLDTFSSGQIPVHLLTAEAFETYFRALAPEGVLAVHISNRHLDLEPVVALAAGRLGLAGMVKHHKVPAEERPLRISSQVVVLAREQSALASLQLGADWQVLKTLKPSWWRRAWTDDAASLVPYLR